MAFNDSLDFAPSIAKLARNASPYHVLLSGYLRKSRTFELYESLDSRLNLDARLIPFELPDDGSAAVEEKLFELLELFKREDNFRSIMVSDPFKRRVQKWTDEITDSAKACGAINILLKDNHIIGDNMDGLSFRAGVKKKHDLDFVDKQMVIFGCGGVGSAVAVQLANDLKKIGLVDPNASRSAELKDLLLRQNSNLDVEIIRSTTSREAITSPTSRDFREFDFVYNGTGLGKFNSASPIAGDDLFNHSGIAFDANYTPDKTPFLQAMEARGYEVINGLSHMMMCTTLHLLATSTISGSNSSNTQPEIDFKTVQECYDRIC